MFATIYLPRFYLQAAVRHQEFDPATAIGVIDEKEKKPLLLEINSIAESAGVRTGMTPSQGLARCLGLVIKTRSNAKEEALTNLLLQAAFTLAPYVEATSPGLCTIEFTDDRNLFAKVSRVIDHLTECEVTARAGIASTADISFLAAHLANPVREIDDCREFLAPLSVDVLSIPFPT